PPTAISTPSLHDALPIYAFALHHPRVQTRRPQPITQTLLPTAICGMNPVRQNLAPAPRIEMLPRPGHDAADNFITVQPRVTVYQLLGSRRRNHLRPGRP